MENRDRTERGWWIEKTNIRVLSVSVKGRSLGDVMKEKRLQRIWLGHIKVDFIPNQAQF